MSDYYFSRCVLDLRTMAPAERVRVLQLRHHHSDYLHHALVWQLFHRDDEAAAAEPDEPRRDFVFRVEQADEGRTVYYTVSRRAPRHNVQGITVTAKPYHPQLQAGERLQFKLRANPTIATRQERSPEVAERYARQRAEAGRKPRPDNGRRIFHDVLMHAKQQARAAGAEPEEVAAAMDAAALDWLLKQAPKFGLSVAPDQVIPEGYWQQRFQHRKREIQFSTVDYAGTATVTDPALLNQALFEGIGRSRAFGCGLLMVRRMPG